MTDDPHAPRRGVDDATLEDHCEQVRAVLDADRRPRRRPRVNDPFVRALRDFVDVFADADPKMQEATINWLSARFLGKRA